MIIYPSPAVSAMVLWIADGNSEEELKQGLSLGYIEYRGVRMNITKIQDYNPSRKGLVTKLVHVQPPTDPVLLNRLTSIE